MTKDYFLKSGTNDFKIDIKQAKVGAGSKKSTTPKRPKSSAIRKN